MRTVLIRVALVAAVPLLAQETREPWRLTLEDRIALRTSVELARERVRRASAEGRRMTTNAAQQTLPADFFDGKAHPELFLPHEVFRSLMTLAFLNSERSGALFRKGLNAEVERVGLPPDFWERLRTVSTVHIADSAAENDLGLTVREEIGARRKAVTDALSLKQLDVCRSRAEAIAGARREFGAERFDRFLYEVIAVNKFHSESQLPSPDVLRWVEGGCR